MAALPSFVRPIAANAPLITKARPTVATTASAYEPINSHLRRELIALRGNATQAGQTCSPPGSVKSQVAHINAPQTLHCWVAATDECCTQRTPSGSWRASGGATRGGVAILRAAHLEQECPPSACAKSQTAQTGAPQS